jgi:hypothetical protein
MSLRFRHISSAFRYPTDRRYRFVQLAADMGVLSPDGRRLALQRIRAKQIGEGTGIRVGEWLVQQHLLPHEARQRVLDEQARLRRAVNARNPTVAMRYRDQTAEGFVALIAVLAAGVLNAYYQWDLDVAVGVPGFVAWAILAMWPMRHGRSATQLVVRAIKYGVAITSPICGVIALNSVFMLQQLTTGVEPFDHQMFRGHILQALVAIVVQSVMIVAMGGLAGLKYLEVRYNEARLGSLRDTLQKVETVFSTARGPSHQVRQQAALVVLRGLRASVSLAPGNVIYGLHRRWDPSFAQLTAFLLVPRIDQRFEIAGLAYSPDATAEVIAAFDRMQSEYYPSMLNSAEFTRLRQLAMGESGSGWKDRFLNLCVKARGKVITACGWAYERCETLYAVDASRCLAYDGSYLACLRESGVQKNVSDWLEVGSFVASPVLDSRGRAVGVLMITSTTTRGFRPQDVELVTATASMLTGIWNRT